MDPNFHVFDFKRIFLVMDRLYSYWRLCFARPRQKIVILRMLAFPCNVSNTYTVRY